MEEVGVLRIKEGMIPNCSVVQHANPMISAAKVSKSLIIEMNSWVYTTPDAS